MLFVLQHLKAQSTYYYAFETTDTITHALFTDYYTGDTIFSSNRTIDSFSVGKHSVLKLKINNSVKQYKELLVNGHERFIITPYGKTGYSKIRFSSSGINQRYHLMQNEISELKIKIDSLSKLLYDKSIDDSIKSVIKKNVAASRGNVQQIINTFFYSNPSSYLSLNYISVQMLAEPASRKSLYKLLSELDPETKKDSLFRVIEAKLGDSVVYEENKSLMPNLNFKNSDNKSVELATLINKSGDTYLVFWASWCYGCHLLFEKLDSLSKLPDYAHTNFVYISFDKNAKAWLKDVEKIPPLQGSYIMSEGFENIDIYRLAFNYLPYIIKLNKQGVIERKGFEFP